MEYLTVAGVGVLAYMAYKQFGEVRKYDEYNQAILVSKRLETLDEQLPRAEPPDPSADVFIPCHASGRPRPVRITSSTKPYLF